MEAEELGFLFSKRASESAKYVRFFVLPMRFSQIKRCEASFFERAFGEYCGGAYWKRRAQIFEKPFTNTRSICYNETAKLRKYVPEIDGRAEVHDYAVWRMADD